MFEFKKQKGVKIYCPITETEEEVFFSLKIADGKEHVHFDGCDHQYSGHPACDKCHPVAFEKLVEKLRNE